MTDHLSDDAISTHLDGGPDAPEAAHLAGCDHCSRRLEQFRAVRRAVADPVPPLPAHVIDRLVANAAGQQRSRPALAAAPWLAAAAALLILIGIVGVVFTADDDDDQLATTAERAQDAEAFASSGAASDLGSHDTVDSVLAALGMTSDDAVASPDSGEATPPAMLGAPAAATPECEVAVDDTVEVHSTLTYRGEPAVAFIVRSAARGDSGRWLLLFSLPACETIAEHPF